MEYISKIFNSQDQTEVKQAFKEIIIAQFKKELEELEEYFFDKNVIDDMINETFKEILSEVKSEMKAMIKNKMLGSLDIRIKKSK
jgi:hypothetical protein